MCNAARFAVQVPLALLVTALLSISISAVADEPASSSAEMLQDAELHDILFLDPDRGWAVGDRGVIWQTEDGGRRWRLVDSPTTARLRSVCFVDDQHGWIAGGWIHPYTQRTSAVLLRTENGGKKWTRIEVPTIPALRRVRFTTPRSGWALGDSSSMYAVGLFQTTDAGYTWTSPPNDELHSFVDGDYLYHSTIPSTASPISVRDPIRSGAASLIDVRGVTWSFSNGAFNPTSAEEGLGPRSVRLSPAGGWLVGQQGRVMQSADGGMTWRNPGPRFPHNVAQEFDWLTVSLWGDQCWIGGAPGTGVLHSPDRGKGWRLLHTGQTLPINRLHFLDDQHGWGVCPLGRILATRDGGQTWRIQRSGGDRVGLVAIHGTHENLPLELLAKTAADEGHLAAVVTLYADENLPRASEEELLRDASSSVGVVSALRIPEVYPLVGHAPKVPLEEPAAELQRSRLQLLERHIVRQLRIWRPDVVLTDNISGSNDPFLSRSAAQAVLQAVQHASDPAFFSDQIVVAGLQPWTVRKVVGAYSANESSRMSIDTGRLSMQLGCSLADFTIPARGLLSDSWSPAPRTTGFRSLWSQASQDVGNRDLFSGMPNAAIGESRREVRSPPQTQIDGLLRAAQQTRDLQEIAAKWNDVSMSTLLPQVEQLLQGLDAAAAGRLLHRLAQQFLENGQYSAASECLSRSVERFPDHTLSDAALLWLLRYNCSAELQQAFRSREVVRLPAPSSVVTAGAVTPSHPSTVQNSAQNSTLAQRALLTTPVPEGAPPVPSTELERVTRIAQIIQQTRPALFAEPRIQFPLASMERRCGRMSEVTRILNTLAASQLATEWRTIASDEQRLLERRVRPMRATANASQTQQKPVLDGDLNDPCWQSAPPILLPSNSARTAEGRFTYDDEFLFVALQCAGSSALPPSEKPGKRTRDASLTTDRVDLWLDVDRDYHTSYRFSVDQLGQTQESCGDGIRWNPQWFVAAAQRDGAWIAEIAIPFAELISTGVAADEAWCIRLQRGAPAPESVCWPAGDSFGLLLFSGGR